MDWDAFYNGSRFVICLYGLRLDKADIVPLAQEIDQLLCALGQPTTHLHVRARGFGQKPLRFDRAFKRLQKTAPEDLVSVSLLTLIENWRLPDDWIAQGTFYPEISYFDLGMAPTSVPDTEERIMELVRRWLNGLRPAYGIGYYRPRKLGPTAYGIGLPYHHRLVLEGPEYEEKRAVQRWGDGMDEAVYDQGILRDVYPYSLLTVRHLEREATDGLALEDWIRAEPWRGQLSACQDGYTLWTIAREHVAVVRRQLAHAGALYVLPRDNHL